MRGETAVPMPADLAGLDTGRRVVIDVRDDIRRGDEPFARIMAAVAALAPGAALGIRAPFEPVPLYNVLGRRGFAHWAERHARDDWTAWFWRDAQGAATPRPAAPGTPAAPSATTLDVRGLEPPQPMVLVLERLESLAPGEMLEVIHDRRPLFLYPQLDERGFAHETDEPAAGLVRLRIRRTGSGR